MIDCNRVLDSCRDKDCFEDVKVFLTRFGREVIDRASSVRIRRAEILAANIALDPLQFNRGFYQVVIRFFVELTVEACVGMGKSQEFQAICAVEKSVVLYGGEGSVNIFKSGSGADSICAFPDPEGSFSGRAMTNLPTAVVEVVDPVVLGCRIGTDRDRNCCVCCDAEDVPSRIRDRIGEDFCCEGEKQLYVSLGFFSVVRIIRPAQYLVSAAEYTVPDKECVIAESDDPCSLFAKMCFPVQEFSPPGLHQPGGCDCQKH